jgi:prepilin-type processing-associated H-X9-DG protein
LPHLEQQAMYNALNFSISVGDTGPEYRAQITVDRAYLSFALCPSDGVTIPPDQGNRGPINYFVNVGGPSPIMTYNGPIAPGPNPWYSNGQMAWFGFAAITDGTSNTAMISEHLLGLRGCPEVLRSSIQSKRAQFFVDMALPRDKGDAAAALAAVRACNSIPGDTLDPFGASCAAGQVWIQAAPFALGINSYNHFNTPNQISCTFQGAEVSWTGSNMAATPNSNHPGGVNICFTDGSVKFIKDTIDVKTWWAIGTRNGGEVVSSDSY